MDTSAVPFREQFRSLDRVYWIANTMEMVERLAYYGLRTVVPLYMVLSVQQGGPEFDHVQKGQIFAIWAAIQSFLPVFTGGYADRYGYKLTVAVSIVIKVIGYLIMGFAIEIGTAISGPEIRSVPGHPTVYTTFLIGAVLLAAGTAIFKPGIQGIVAVRLTGANASLGWALFYQLVNIGGFLGPYLASSMRLLEWRWVFVSCAVVVCLNFLLLPTFAEPEKGGVATAPRSFLRVMWDSLIGICEPRLMAFLVLFSGFWMMFYQLFDLLPNFISDWVDSSGVVAALVAPLFGAFGWTIPAEWGGQLPAEQLINVNSGLIMIFAFAVGYVTGRVRSMTAMIVGIFVSSVAIGMLSLSWSAWMVIAAVAVFSFGEMAASPTKLRYVADIAPVGRKGLYLGYVNATNGIGWSVGSLVAGAMYQAGGDKVVLARRYLVDVLGRDPAEVEAIPKDDVVGTLAAAVSVSPRELLWDTYHPERIWWWFAFVGLVSMIGLVGFDRITRLRLRSEPAILIALTAAISLVTYGPVWAVVFAGLMVLYLALERFAPSAVR